jgi:hypothetical protein
MTKDLLRLRRRSEPNTRLEVTEAESDSYWEPSTSYKPLIPTIRKLWLCLLSQKEGEEEKHSEEAENSDESGASEDSLTWGAVCQEKKDNLMIVDLYKQLYPDLVGLAHTKFDSIVVKDAKLMQEYSKHERRIYHQINALLYILDVEYDHLLAEITYPRAQLEMDKASLHQQRMYPELDHLGRQKYSLIHPCDQKNERLIYYHLGAADTRLERRSVIRENRKRVKIEVEANLLEQETHPELDFLGRRKYLPILPGQRKSERVIYWGLSDQDAERERTIVIDRHHREALAVAKCALDAAYIARRMAMAAGTYKVRLPGGMPVTTLAHRAPGKQFWLGI